MQKNAWYRLPLSRSRKAARKSAKETRQRVTLTTPTERTTCRQGIGRPTLSHHPEEIHTISPVTFLRINALQTYAPISKLRWGRQVLNSHRFSLRYRTLLY